MMQHLQYALQNSRCHATLILSIKDRILSVHDMDHFLKRKQCGENAEVEER